MNDLWMFNTTTKLWTWTSGSSLVNSPGVYGTKGLPAVENVPFARYRHTTSIDSTGQFVFLFAGIILIFWFTNYLAHPKFRAIQRFVDVQCDIQDVGLARRF